MAFPGPLPVRQLLLGLVTLSLVLSSCSGGGSGAPAKAASDTTVAPGGGAPGTTTGAAPSGSGGPPGPDAVRLQTIVLAAADLPAGWTARPSASTPDSEAATALGLAQCLGTRNVDVDLVAGVVSPEFTKGQTTIASSAHSYLSADDVTTATASFTNPKFSSCYQQVLGNRAQNLFVKVTPGSAGGPANVVATATISASPPASTSPTTTTRSKTTKKPVATTVKPSGFLGTIVFITGPRLTAELDFFGIGEEVPAAVRAQLTAKLAARAAAG